MGLGVPAALGPHRHLVLSVFCGHSGVYVTASSRCCFNLHLRKSVVLSYPYEHVLRTCGMPVQVACPFFKKKMGLAGFFFLYYFSNYFLYNLTCSGFKSCG